MYEEVQDDSEPVSEDPLPIIDEYFPDVEVNNEIPSIGDYID